MTDPTLVEKVARAIYNWRREKMVRGATGQGGRITHSPAFWNQLPESTRLADIEEARLLIDLHSEDGMAETDLLAACVGAAIS